MVTHMVDAIIPKVTRQTIILLPKLAFLFIITLTSKSIKVIYLTKSGNIMCHNFLIIQFMQFFITIVTANLTKTANNIRYQQKNKNCMLI
jgi:hypothetical protein